MEVTNSFCGKTDDKPLDFWVIIFSQTTDDVFFVTEVIKGTASLLLVDSQ